MITTEMQLPAGQRNPDSLGLAETLYLMCLDTQKGRCHFISRHPLKYAVTAALLYELTQLGRIEFKDEILVIRDSNPSGNDFHDRVLERIVELSRDRKLSWWLGKLSFIYSEIRNQIIKNLLSCGVIRHKRITSGQSIHNRYEIWNDSIYRRIKSKLDRLILDQKKTDDNTRVLAALIWSCRASGKIYRDKKIAGDAKYRMNIIGETSDYSRHVRKSINAVRGNVVTAILTIGIPVLKNIL